VLHTIESSSAHLINPLSLVHWSLAKSYLRDLEERGGAIVPSLWFDDFDEEQIPDWFEQLGTDKVVIKPTVGTNSQHTFIIDDPASTELVSELEMTFGQRPFFVQPFMTNVQTSCATQKIITC